MVTSHLRQCGVIKNKCRLITYFTVFNRTGHSNSVTIFKFQQFTVKKCDSSTNKQNQKGEEEKKKKKGNVADKRLYKNEKQSLSQNNALMTFKKKWTSGRRCRHQRHHSMLTNKQSKCTLRSYHTSHTPLTSPRSVLRAR